MIEIYDNIHGMIEIPDNIKCIIDTREFQRLRKIKQLGLVYNVFTGASHNRFEHSLGVYFLAKKYIQILNTDIIDQGCRRWFNTKQEHLISVAALIHDLGHGPFSHLFDDLTDSSHEIRSIEIFKNMNLKYDLKYNENDIQFIENVIFGNYSEHTLDKYLYQIVSNKNGIDVDRMDYILRDIKMTGLNYGIEISQIMKNSYITRQSKRFEIFYKDKIYLQVQHFFHVRYILYKNVYNHTTVRAIEFMIKDILGKIDKIFKITEFINKKDWDKFTILNDSILDIAYYQGVELINNNPDSLPYDDYKDIINLIDRINNRDLYKQIDSDIVSNKKINISQLRDSLINDNIIDKNNERIFFDSVQIKSIGNKYPKFESKIFSLMNLYESHNNSELPVEINEYIIKIYKK